MYRCFSLSGQFFVIFLLISQINKLLRAIILLTRHKLNALWFMLETYSRNCKKSSENHFHLPRPNEYQGKKWHQNRSTKRNINSQMFIITTSNPRVRTISNLQGCLKTFKWNKVSIFFRNKVVPSWSCHISMRSVSFIPAAAVEKSFWLCHWAFACWYVV